MMTDRPAWRPPAPGETPGECLPELDYEEMRQDTLRRLAVALDVPLELLSPDTLPITHGYWESWAKPDGTTLPASTGGPDPRAETVTDE